MKPSDIYSGLTANMVRELFDYSPDTGLLTRRVRTANCTAVGDVAGTTSRGNYVCVKIDGRPYKAHRLVWLYVHGRWPEEEIDHINGVPTDNRLGNLREASRRTNVENKRSGRSDNKGGLLGVSAHGNKYLAQIQVNGEKRHIGCFATPSEAHDAYLTAKRRLHDGCTV